MMKNIIHKSVFLQRKNIEYKKTINEPGQLYIYTSNPLDFCYS